jgi:hypothetical protein
MPMSSVSGLPTILSPPSFPLLVAGFCQQSTLLRLHRSFLDSLLSSHLPHEITKSPPPPNLINLVVPILDLLHNPLHLPNANRIRARLCPLRNR